jgi:hypothetical protein
MAPRATASATGATTAFTDTVAGSLYSGPRNSFARSNSGVTRNDREVGTNAALTETSWLSVPRMPSDRQVSRM